MAKNNKTTSGSKKKTSVKNLNPIVKVVIAIGIVATIIGIIYIIDVYGNFFKPNVSLQNKKETYICIPTGSDIKKVGQILYENGIIKDKNTFEWVAQKKKYSSAIKPGRYLIKDNMSNNELISLLKSGTQTPVKLVFNNVRSIEQLAGKVSKQLEADSLSIISLLKNKEFIAKYSFNSYSLPALFIPNTYEFYWFSKAE